MKNKKMSLQEELKRELQRFNSINRYTKKLVMEQDLPDEPVDDQLPPPDNTGGDELPLPNEPDMEEKPEGDEETPEDEVSDEIPEPESDDETEEIDITDLVNMTQNIKQELEKKEDNSQNVIQKMDGVFEKLNDLQNRLSEMDRIIAKIDALKSSVEEMRPLTPQEKLEMRSIDSGPFKEKPSEFFSQKQDEMRKSGKNEYVLTSDDVKSYSKDQIMRSFNPDIGQERRMY